MGALSLSAVGLVCLLADVDPDVVRRGLRASNAERTRRVLGELKGGVWLGMVGVLCQLEASVEVAPVLAQVAAGLRGLTGRLGP